MNYEPRTFSPELREFLEKYETEIGQLGDTWLINPRVLGTHTPRLSADNSAYIMGRAIELAGVRMVEKWYAKLGRFIENFDEDRAPTRQQILARCGAAWRLHQCELDAYTVLTHLQGTVVPYLYTTVMVCSINMAMTRSSVLLFEQVDESTNFVKLGDWIHYQQERGGHLHSSIPTAAFQQAINTHRSASRARMMGLHNYSYTLLEQTVMQNEAKLCDWDMVCIRTFCALRLIHQAGVSHGSLSNEKILVHKQTLMPVFTGFELSMLLDRVYDGARHASEDCNQLKRIWNISRGKPDYEPRRVGGGQSSFDVNSLFGAWI